MTRIKINSQLLPIKIHFFFFMAAMGPILPFLSVYGKQLGISTVVLGVVTGILPLLILVIKPAFGFLVDRFRTWRRLIFLGLLAATSSSFVFMYFLPTLSGPVLPVDGLFPNVSCTKLSNCNNQKINVADSCKRQIIRSTCSWKYNETTNLTGQFLFYGDNEARIGNGTSCLENNNDFNFDLCRYKNALYDISCDVSNRENACLYNSTSFWGFVILMTLGIVGYNVCNCISDAICFDVLGEGGQMNYGRQRVWGSIGFGIAAFMTGYAMDWWSADDAVKSYVPAFILISIFSIIDFLCCSRLQLPIIPNTKGILKDVVELIQIKPIAIFFCFAIIAGVLDSFIIYYLFWYLEDLGTISGSIHEIKLIEGLTIFAETLGGEVIFFSLSGKILKNIGYGYSFFASFVCYALRLGLISLAWSPRWIVGIEFLMQGPTYALFYATSVAYASSIAPPGASATIQGIVTGMDDGIGLAAGSVIGGILYKKFGGAITLRLYAALAFFTAVIYLILYLTFLKHVMPETNLKKKYEQKNPQEATKMCEYSNE